MHPSLFSRSLATLTALVLAALMLGLPATAAAKKKNRGIVAGVVLNKAGEPLDDARVTMSSTADPGVRFEATSDAEGAFEIDIPEAGGEYLLRVERQGYGSFETTIPLDAGERQDVKLELVEADLMRKNDAVAAYNAGVKAFDAEDVETAKAKFLQALELDPDLVQPHLGLADIYLRQKSYDEAAAAMDRFLAGAPAEAVAQAQVLAYEVYRQAGQEKKVATALAALADTDVAPQLAVRTYNDGVSANLRGDQEGAMAKFRQALELDPTLGAPYAALATMLYNRQEYAPAKELLAKLLELEPDNVQGRRIRFLVHDALGEDEAAAAAFEAYLELDAEAAAELLYQRADIDFRNGDSERALGALKRVLEIVPDMPRAHYTLGLVYAGSDAAKAREHLRRFIELAPEDPEVPTAQQIIDNL